MKLNPIVTCPMFQKCVATSGIISKNTVVVAALARPTFIPIVEVTCNGTFRLGLGVLQAMFKMRGGLPLRIVTVSLRVTEFVKKPRIGQFWKYEVDRELVVTKSILVHRG
jgi:hypothetical protein